MRIATGFAIAIPLLVLIWVYMTGYGWLIREDRWPPESTVKAGGTCRYQTLRGIRIAYYHGPCPKYATTPFPDKQERY